MIIRSAEPTSDRKGRGPVLNISVRTSFQDDSGHTGLFVTLWGTSSEIDLFKSSEDAIFGAGGRGSIDRGPQHR